MKKDKGKRLVVTLSKKRPKSQPPPTVSLPDLSTENPCHDRKVTVTLLDMVTGETVKNSDWSTWWWTEGNGSCDCNRRLQFDDDVLGEKLPCRSIRYRIVAVEPMLPGYTLAEFNEGYPDAMDYLDLNATWEYVSEYEPPLKEVTPIG